MKKKLFFALVLCVAFGSIRAYDFSAVAPSGQTLYYTILAPDTVMVTSPYGSSWGYYTKPTGDLDIPSHVTNGAFDYVVIAVDNFAFSECYSITSVIIPSTIIYLGRYAFYNCSGLQEITVPNSVQEIGDNAFVGVGVVYYSGGAEGAPWGAGLVVGHEENGLFYADSAKTVLVACSDSLTSATLPLSVREIKAGAFANHTQLASIELNEGLEKIGRRAFAYCSTLTSIVIPSTTTTIGDEAFTGCRGLTSVTVPANVTDIGMAAFSHCSNIATVNYNAVNCTQGSEAFAGLSALTTLNIASNVQRIPRLMFAGCTGLITLTLPDAVTDIGNSAFMNCINLTNANLGNGLISIDNMCFSGCLRLMNVRLSDALTYIGHSAFYNCGIVGELIIQQGVIGIAALAFGQCYGINKITALGRVAPVLHTTEEGYGPFYGVDSNIVVNIPCETRNMYAGRWPQFHNFVEMPFIFNAVSEDINKGTVTVESNPTCSNPYATIKATPKNGFEFDHWSDGSTSNPYSYTATGSVTLIGYFRSDVGIEGINETAKTNIAVADGCIVVQGEKRADVQVYDVAGRLVATAKTGESISLPASGLYMVCVDGVLSGKVSVVR